MSVHALYLDILLLRHLTARNLASAPEFGIDYRITADEVRSRLVVLESMRFVDGRQDFHSQALRRVFHVTAEGRRKAGISDARRAT